MIYNFEGKAIASYLPKETSATRAWTLAKVSLRSLKRDLRRKQAKIHSGNYLNLFGNLTIFYSDISAINFKAQ